MSARTTPASEGAGLSDGERIAALGVGALLLASTLIFVAGEANALLTSGSFLHSGFTATPGTLMRLSRHGNDPALAWPAKDHALLPGPFQFYGVTVVLLGLLLAAFVVILRVWARFGFAGGRDRDARFAAPRDLGLLRVKRATIGRVTLGRAGGTLLAAEVGRW